VPDWLIAVARPLLTAIEWPRRAFRRRVLRGHELAREGSNVVTPVMEFTRKLGPASIRWGDDDLVAHNVRENYARWEELRGRLKAYGNHHPSDRVWELTAEAEKAVALDLTHTPLCQRQPMTTSFTRPCAVTRMRSRKRSC
jgi:hypothetical protein